MSALIDRIKAHARPGEVRHIEVPEWGEPGQPLVIYFSMVTLADLSVAQAAHPKDPLRQSVDILCMKAQDEKGKPLFSRIDGTELMTSADPAVLNRVIIEMGQRLPAEDIEKN